jgi:phospholipase C
MGPTAANAMDHVVLVLFENRSFDNLLGQLYTPEEMPDFEGVLGRELTNPVPNWAKPVPPGAGREPGIVRFTPAPDGNTPDPDPGEEFAHTNTQLYGIIDDGNLGTPAHKMKSQNMPGPDAGVAEMQGFVADYISAFRALKGEDPDYGQYRQIMQGHTREQVPVLSDIARGFVVFDHWFSEVPSQTFPNRSFWTAASSSGLVVNSPATEWYFHNAAETLFDRLEAHGKTWKVYVLEPCPLSITGAIHTPRLKKWFSERFVPFAQFEEDAAAGALPDFALIEPNLLAGHADYHPPFGDTFVRHVDLGVDTGSAVDAGEQFLARLYGAVRSAPGSGASNVWNTTLFIGWDEPGGTYDHVPPPAAVPPDDSTGQHGFAFDRSGYRVPAILVSPWVPERTVRSEELRHTSMIATLRAVWDLGGPLTRRDESARTFEGVFSLGTPRDPATWPDVSGAAGARPLPVEVDRSLGSLARHLVHGIAHLGRSHGLTHGDGPDSFDPHAADEVALPPRAFVVAAEVFGGYFFPKLGHPAAATVTPARTSPTGRSVEAAPIVQSIGGGLAMEYAYPSLESVEVSLLFHGRRLWHFDFSPDTPERRHHVDLGLIRLDLTFCGDLFAGTITWAASVDTRSWFGRPWVARRDLSAGSVIRFDPSIGEIDGRVDVYPPIVFVEGYTPSQNCTGTILRVHVERARRDLCAVGSRVKDVMFPDPYPPFVFNAVAAVGAFDEDGPQCYANPESPWFNVFLGYYQLDCAKDRWDRPFGFHTAQGIESEPAFDDLVRLGKADWNFFSNWDYGVPERFLLPHCSPDYSPADAVDGGLVEVGPRSWRRVELHNVEVASCYESDHPSAERLVANTPMTGVFRKGFGYPSPRPGRPVSFVPQTLDAVLHMAYFEDAESYHTLIFGGTAHAGQDRALLDAEVAATLAVIADQYAHRGFAARDSRVVPSRADATRQASA